MHSMGLIVPATQTFQAEGNERCNGALNDSADACGAVFVHDELK